MKSTVLVCTLAAALLGLGSLSYAQGDDRGQGRDGRAGAGARDGGGQRQWQDGGQSRRRQPDYRGQADNQHRKGPPQAQWGQQQRRFPAQGQWGAQRHDGQPGSQHGDQVQPQWQGRYDGRVQPQWQGRHDEPPQRGWRGQGQRFRSGDYLPPEYRQRRAYVNDWRAHRLYAPPVGHQWVQVDTGDYLLIALTTGVIANLLLGQ